MPLYLAAQDHRTPWCARLLVAGIVAYAFSPIDLASDFVPVLGYLDILILMPMGISLAVRLVPYFCFARLPRAGHGNDPEQKARELRLQDMAIVAIWLAPAAICIVWAHAAFLM